MNNPDIKALAKNSSEFTRIMQDVLSKLRLARAKKGWSLDRVATEALKRYGNTALNSSYLSRLERGLIPIPLRHLWSICTVLDLTFEEIFVQERSDLFPMQLITLDKTVGHGAIHEYLETHSVEDFYEFIWAALRMARVIKSQEVKDVV